MAQVTTGPLTGALGATPGSSITGSFDPRALDAVRLAAKNDDAASTRKVAQQFESMFLSMMLKNMRATLPGADPLASDASKMATDLYDQQLAQTMAKGKGIGLADALVAQIQRAQGKNPDGTPLGVAKAVAGALSGSMPATMTHATTPVTTSATTPGTATSAAPTTTPGTSIHHTFVDRFKDAAVAAAEATGLPAKVILGQAALESGWGKHEVRDVKGTGSFNLFGIKAPAGWTGADGRRGHDRGRQRRRAEGRAEVQGLRVVCGVVHRLREDGREQPALREGGAGRGRRREVRDRDGPLRLRDRSGLRREARARADRPARKAAVSAAARFSFATRCRYRSMTSNRISRGDR